MTYVAELREALGDCRLLPPSPVLIALDPDGRVLLLSRTDDGTWGLPGGLLEIGEVTLFDLFGGSELYHDYPGRGRGYDVSVATSRTASPAGRA
jgi:hypothetical protein